MNFIIIALFCSSCLFTIAICSSSYRIDGRTYYASYPDKRNWHEAKRFCTYNGMYLVDVRTDAENERILSVINQTETVNKIAASNWWTSGTDQGSANTFYWDTTGHPMLYVDWASKQPDDSGSKEHCVQYWEKEQHKWNDARCEHKLYFICRDTFDVPNYKTKECGVGSDYF